MEMSKKALNKAEINDLISLSGEDLYINNYLMPIILSYLKAMDNDDQISILKSNLNLSESDSNKIRIGDYLINLSDNILGIGGQKVNDELRLYFPQFNLLTIEDKIKMIGEGIKIKSKNNSGKIQKVCELEQLLGIDQLFCQKPIILNVGRLADVKGQKALFNAFANSKLNETYNLLIIGGDIENPNLEEKATIDFFAKEIIEKPYLKSKFFHHAALPNDQVNIIESTIMQNQFDYPHIYLSSSIKEEFGLAILEAMSHGFLILGPIKGGVKTYVKNGENGFLIDTSNWETIARDTEKIIYDDNFTLDQFKAIQKQGQLTVEENFSIEKISKKFTKTYLALLGGKNNEV